MKIRRVLSQLTIEFEDGRLVNVQASAQEEPSGDMSNASLQRMVSVNNDYFYEQMKSIGVEGLYKRSCDMRGTTPEDPYVVMVGIVEKALPTLPAEYVEPVRRWLNYVFRTTRHPVLLPQFPGGF